MNWKEWRLMRARMDFLEQEPHKTAEDVEERAMWGRVVHRVEMAVETACNWREGEAFCRVYLRQEKPRDVAESLGISESGCRRLAGRARRKVESLLSLFGWWRK